MMMHPAPQRQPCPSLQLPCCLCRLLVRAKVFQLVGCSGIALAVAAVMTSPDAGSSDAAAAVALAVCCAAASYSLWYYSRRYVGELALLEGGKVVRFSVLDFWGNREVGASSSDCTPTATHLPAQLGLALLACMCRCCHASRCSH